MRLIDDIHAGEEVTYHEPSDSILAHGVLSLLAKSVSEKPAPRGVTQPPMWSVRERMKRELRDTNLLLTVLSCWSGYSECTITSTWAEITVEWGRYELHFESMAEFFRAVADADVNGADR